MKNLILIFLVLTSILAYGQNYSEYYRGSRTQKTIASDSVIVGARFINTSDLGKAGIQLMIGSDTGEVYLDSNTLFISGSEFVNIKADSNTTIDMRSALNNQRARIISGYDADFGASHFFIIDKATEDSLIAGYLDISAFFGYSVPAYGSLLFNTSNDTASIIFTQVPGQSSALYSGGSSSVWTMTIKNELVDFALGAVDSRRILFGLSNNQSGFANSYFSQLLLNDNEAKLSYKDSSASEISVILLQEVIKLTSVIRKRIKQTYPNTGLAPLVYIDGNATLDTSNCLDCYPIGLRIDWNLEDADGDSVSSTSGSIYTEMTLDSGIVAPIFYDWQSSTLINDSSHVDFGASVEVSSDTATDGRAVKWVGYYVRHLEGDSTFGFYIDDNYDETKAGFAGGIYIGDTSLSNTFKGNLHIGGGTTTTTSVGLDLNATNKALLLNRMTTAQRNSLTPVNGMIIYNSTTSDVETYEGGSWLSSDTTLWTRSGGVTSLKTSSDTADIGGLKISANGIGYITNFRTASDQIIMRTGRTPTSSFANFDLSRFGFDLNDTIGNSITSGTVGGAGMIIVSDSVFRIRSTTENTEPILRLENNDGNVKIFRTDGTPEGTMTADSGSIAIDQLNGSLYIKKSGSGNTGWILIGGAPTFKSYPLSNPGTAGTFQIGGHYGYSAADANLTIGGTVTQTLGTAGEAHASHAFCVASGAGGTDLVLTVTGISITDAGVKNGADSEVIVADTDAASTNEFFQTSKKWLGQVTYTLTGAAGSFDFNFGFVKYDDFGNRNFTITDFECTGEGRASETDWNVELLHHEATAFVYSAAAFSPNQTAFVSLGTDHGTDGNDFIDGMGIAYKRAGLSQAVNGANGEGILIRVTTVVNNSINDMVCHIGVTLQ